MAATRAVGLTYIASLAGCVGSRRAGQQSALVSSRTACDTNRPTLLSPGASAVGRLKSHQVRLWTATAVAGQPSPSASRPSASRSCAEPDVSDQFPRDRISEFGLNERTTRTSVFAARDAASYVVA